MKVFQILYTLLKNTSITCNGNLIEKFLKVYKKGDYDIKIKCNSLFCHFKNPQIYATKLNLMDLN